MFGESIPIRKSRKCFYAESIFTGKPGECFLAESIFHKESGKCFPAEWNFNANFRGRIQGKSLNVDFASPIGGGSLERFNASGLCPLLSNDYDRADVLLREAAQIVC